MNQENKVVQEEATFKREIGVFGGVSLIGGIMIGSGLFYLGSYVLERTGMSLGLSLLAWILGGIISLMGGLCYAELGVSIPRAGGATVYLTEAYHPLVGFLRGFNDWLLAGPGSLAAMAIALPTALRSFVDLSDMQIKLIAVAIIILLTVYNLFGIKQGTVLQNISMIVKMVPIFVIIIAALSLGKESPDLSLTLAGNESVSFFGICKMVAFATVASLWAYEGWTNLNNMTEEIKEPHKNLPRALLLGIGGITLLYTIFHYAIYRVLSLEEITGYIAEGNLYLGTEVTKRVLGQGGGLLVAVAMVLAIFNGLNGLIIAQPRQYYAMAVEGHFFKSFAKLHPKYRVPTAPLLVQMILSIILIFMRNLDQLTSLVVFTGMFFNVLVVFSVYVLRKKYPDIPRPYKVAGYPFVVFLTTLIFIGLLINTLVEDPVNSLTGLAVQVLALLSTFSLATAIKRKL